MALDAKLDNVQASQRTIASIGTQNGASLDAVLDHCAWQGVVCEIVDAERRVVALELAGWGLTGELPVRVRRLARLRRLELADNALTGTLPTSSLLWRLAELEVQAQASFWRLKRKFAG